DAAGDAAGQHLLLGGDVEQGVLHLQAATGRHDVADHHVLGAQGLPVAEDHFAGLGRLADHVLPWNRRVVARVAQVVADDLGHVVRQHATALQAERHHRDRRCPVAAAGDQDVLFLCHGHACHAAEHDQQSSKEFNHNDRSSGVNVILNERYGLNSFGFKPCISVSRPMFLTAATAELSNGPSPLERDTLTLVMVPSGSMLICRTTVMPLRADGGRAQPSAARLRIRSSKSPATWSPCSAASACCRSAASDRSSTRACAFLSSAALRAASCAFFFWASAAAFFLASSAAFFFASSAAAFFLASSAAFFLASSAAFFLASSAAFFFSSSAFFLA